jgi:TonB family protein
MEQYGAIELKKNYRKYLKIGLIAAIFIHFFIISGYFFAGYLKNEEVSEKKYISKNIDLSNIEIPPSIEDKEVPQEIEKISSVKDLTALTPQPVARELAEELTIKTQEQLENINVPVGNDSGKFQYTGTENVKIEDVKIIEKIENIEIKEKINYQSFEVEKVPECVNLNQIRSLMKYPELAIEAQIEGKVTVKVLVGVDGSVEKVGNISGPEIFYSEVKEKSKLLQFTPGLQNGKAVNVWISVPFNFKLN